MLTLTVAKPQKIFWYEDDKLTKHFEDRLKTAIQNVQKHVTKIIIINVNHSRNTQRSVFQCYQGISRIIWRSAEVVVECWYFQQHCCFGLSSDCKNSPTRISNVQSFHWTKQGKPNMPFKTFGMSLGRDFTVFWTFRQLKTNGKRHFVGQNCPPEGNMYH